ncbi:hypothetical protein Droror1_Dr00024262 [Drosera rotundifolia]
MAEFCSWRAVFVVSFSKLQRLGEWESVVVLPDRNGVLIVGCGEALFDSGLKLLRLRYLGACGFDLVCELFVVEVNESRVDVLREGESEAKLSGVWESGSWFGVRVSIDEVRVRWPGI